MTRRLVFMGSDPIALPMLRALRAGVPDVECVAVYTQPDRATGRGQRVRSNPVKQWAESHGIPVRQPDRLTEEEREILAGLRPDFALVMAYGHLLRTSWLETPPMGIYNLHTSLLPRYRGASPIQATVMDGCSTGGVTLMKMVLQLDAGPVIEREEVPIGRLETAGSLEEKLATACVPLVLRHIRGMAGGNPASTPQDEDKVSYTRRLQKADGVLDFAAGAEVLARRINGLFPWPGVVIPIGETPVRCGLAEAIAAESRASPGTVLESEGNALEIATGNGVLRLLRLQRPGGRMLDAPAFLRGFSLSVGTVLGSRPMPKLISDRPFPR